MPKPNFKRPAAVPFNLKDATFAYVSDCCNELAKKQSVSSSAKANPCDRPKRGGMGTLGKFHCGSCNKRCKVHRTSKSNFVPVQK